MAKAKVTDCEDDARAWERGFLDEVEQTLWTLRCSPTTPRDRAQEVDGLFPKAEGECERLH